MQSGLKGLTRTLLPPLPAVGARLRSATATITAIAVVAAAILVAAWINTQAVGTAQLVGTSIEIRERAERFLGHVRDAETGQRGFLLTGDEEALRPYHNGRAAALPELDALASLLKGREEQAARVAQARELTISRFKDLDATLALAKEGRRADAILAMREGEAASSSMVDLRETVRQIQLAETTALISLNRREHDRRIQASIGIIVALAALAFAAWQSLRVRQRRTRSLASYNAELEALVAQRTQQLENERIRVEALLRDVSHRVGNNLAMISALLSVQSRKTSEPAVKAALAQAQERIQAIAAGQRRLRLDVQADEIDAKEYLTDLIAELTRAAEGRPITIELAVADVRLRGRDAVSLVVVINELVTNAVKHAFPGDVAGRVLIRLEDDPAQPAMRLIVEDDGIGMQAKAANASGLGQTVIASLLRSMSGTLATEPACEDPRRPGTRVTITFAGTDA